MMWMGENILGYLHPKAKGINTVRMMGMCMEMMY
jgi:hypothetical protein